MANQELVKQIEAVYHGHHGVYGSPRIYRELDEHRPNQKWLSDIAYIPTQEGWLYLAAILDLHARRIVGWAMADQMTSELTIDALEMALRQRQPGTGLIHHSDRAPVSPYIVSGGDTPFPAEEGTAQRLTQRSKDQWGQSVTW